MKTSLSLLTLFACAAAGTALFADNENYDGRDLSGRDFSDDSLKNSSWINANLTSADLRYATLTGADFTGATLKNVSIYGVSAQNVNFTDANLTGADFYSNHLVYNSNHEADLRRANFFRANLTSANLCHAALTWADFTDAVIDGVDFSFSNLTLSQLCSTASYKQKNLSGVRLDGLDLSNAEFSGFNLTSATFWGVELAGADFTDAVIIGADFIFADLSLSQLYSTASYKQKDLSGVGLGTVSTWGHNLRNGNFFGFNLTSTNFFRAKLTGADFTDAVIIGADFSFSDLSLSQLYSTASYKQKDLSGVGLREFALSNENFSGFNLTSADLRYATLTNADFSGANLTSASLCEARLTGANLTGADLTGADFRGATGLSLTWNTTKQTFSNSMITGTNVILADGTIGAFDVASGTAFRIAGYNGVSAKLRDRRTMSGTLVLEDDATLVVCADASLQFERGETHFIAYIADSGRIFVKSGGGVTFSETAKLVIDFKGKSSTYFTEMVTGSFTEDTRFSVLTWENGASVTGLDMLMKGDTLSLLVGGVALDCSLWDFSTSGNALTIFGVSGDSDEPIISDNPVIPDDSIIPEAPKNIVITTASQSVGLSDTDYKASFASSLKTFFGRVSGSGELHSSYDVTFSGDARAHTGTTKVESGTLTIAQSANLGTGAFDVVGILALIGNRTFSNETTGSGKLEVSSGSTKFMTDVGVKILAVSQGATATLNSDVDLTHTDANAQVAGTLNLLGSRIFSAAMSGNGEITLASEANVAFTKAVGVKTLSVEQGATLRGNVSLTHDSAELSLAGELVLNADDGEKVSLGGGKAVLADMATLDLVGNMMTYSRASSGQVAALESGRKVSIFENGEVAGDVLAFLSTDSDLAIYAQDYAVIYDASNGLSVQVVKNAGALVGNAGTSGLDESFVDWALASLTSGFISTADFSNLPGGNDSLLQAVISGDSGAARAILDRLSPKSYAAMVAMPTEAFNSDVRSISARLEQRRFEHFDEKTPWVFFAQAQTNSAENDSSASSPTFDFDTYGVLAGADYSLDKNTAVGIALGVGTGEAKIHNGGGKIESMDFRLTGYAGKRFENYFVNAGAQLGYASYDVKRKTDYGNANGDTTGWSVGVFADAGTVLTISEEKNVYATPYVGFAYMHTQAGGFSESGSDKAFDADDISGDSLRVRVGCGFSWGFGLAEKAWRVGLDFAYSHDFLGDEVDVDVTTADGHKISETAKALPESMFSVGPTLNVDLNASTSLYGGYTFSSGTDSYVNHGANVGFRVLF